MTLLINNFETAYMNCPAAAVLAATKLQVSCIGCFGYPRSCVERSVGENLHGLGVKSSMRVEPALCACEGSLYCSHAEAGRDTQSNPEQSLAALAVNTCGDRRAAINTTCRSSDHDKANCSSNNDDNNKKPGLVTPPTAAQLANTAR